MTSVSVMSYGEPKAPRSNAAYAWIGLCPLMRTKIAPRRSATRTETTGTAGPWDHCDVG